MNKPEILKPKDIAFSASEELHAAQNSLTKTEVEEIYSHRQSCLEKARLMVSLEFYHQIREKLEEERRFFERLLHWEDAKEDLLSHYSFVLNPRYFEQKFFGSEI